MSVPSSKTTVAEESPNFDTERISSTSGSPAMAASTGTVMRRSTSAGARAGAVVSTWTWTLVTSGTASIGSRSMCSTPTAMASRLRTSTRKRLRSDHATSAAAISGAPRGCRAAGAP